MSLAYLAACYWLGSNYHSGQWSRGYRCLCQAQQYSLREYGVDLGRHWDQLSSHSRLQGQQYRNYVAYWLRRMKGSRYSL